jgi:hypothetical protein
MFFCVEFRDKWYDLSKENLRAREVAVKCQEKLGVWIKAIKVGINNRLSRLFLIQEKTKSVFN